MAMLACRYFSGYKPCGRNAVCDDQCPSFSIARPHILLVHLEALGAVLRATTLLPAIKRRYPHSHITWVTKAPADQLLKNLESVDRVLTLANEDLLSLRALHFDLGLVVDKSLTASGVLKMADRVAETRGFVANPQTGAIECANPEAEELWSLGLSDHKKFFVNKKPETQLLLEAMALGPFQRDEYQVQFSPKEESEIRERRNQWLGGRELIIGLNTGCSGVIQYKRWTVEYQRRLIQAIKERFNATVVLLGGPEDQVRNQSIASGLSVIQSPTQRGLRDGLCSVAACDQIISGDSLGMHMGIACRKWVVAWFGPTCAHEIDLYDRGVALQAQVGCSPCWKRSCEKTPMCYDQVRIEDVISAVEQGLKWKASLSKPHSLGTLSFQSP